VEAGGLVADDRRSGERGETGQGQGEQYEETTHGRNLKLGKEGDANSQFTPV
jgi:hypothetical protein